METIRYSLICSCGHQGMLIYKEANPSATASMALYTLRDIQGGVYASSHDVDLETVFDHLKPVCPKCNKMLTPSHAAETSNV